MNTTPNVARAVRKAVARTPAGKPFVGSRLAVHGQPSAVQRELSRLVQAGVLRRPAHGVFVRPETSAYVKGHVPAEISTVVQAIAEHGGAKVQVHGAEAAQRMGFSTQVPVQSIFQTTGPSRQLKVGARVVHLKHASPRKLALAGRPAGVALAALWFLGKREVHPETFEKIAQRLGPSEFRVLASARSQMPAWMIRALEQYESKHSVG